MIIPMPKKEYITIQMNPEHSSRYQVLTGALLERQQSDRSYLAACYLLSAETKSSILPNRMCRLTVSTLRPSVCV